jgi:ribosomal protein L37AE/L43A
MSNTCPDCHSTDVADLKTGGRICLDCERTWGVPKR